MVAAFNQFLIPTNVTNPFDISKSLSVSLPAPEPEESSFFGNLFGDVADFTTDLVGGTAKGAAKFLVQREVQDFVESEVLGKSPIITAPAAAQTSNLNFDTGKNITQQQLPHNAIAQPESITAPTPILPNPKEVTSVGEVVQSVLTNPIFLGGIAAVALALVLRKRK